MSDCPKISDGLKLGFARRHWKMLLGGVLLLLVAAIAVSPLVSLRAWRLYYSIRHRDKFSGHANYCSCNLRTIACGCLMYAHDHEGRFPDHVDELFPKYYTGSKRRDELLTCPYGGRERVPLPHYVIVPDLSQDLPPFLVLGYERPLENHRGRGRRILAVDGHVEWRRAQWDLDGYLKAQCKALESWRAAGARAEDISKYFEDLEEKFGW